MSKSRVYEIAKELNVDSKLIIEKCKAMNVDVKNHSETGIPETSCTKTAGKTKSGKEGAAKRTERCKRTASEQAKR